MNLWSQMRFLGKTVVYQEQEELVGKVIRVDIEDPKLLENLQAIIQNMTDAKLYEHKNKMIKAAIDKYGILKLTFSLGDFSLKHEGNSIQILKDQGFLQKEEYESEEEKIELQDYFQTLLEVEIEKLREKRFYYIVFARATEGGLEPWLKMRYKKNWLGKQKKRKLRFVDFTIQDACITNMTGIWFNKYFYL